jgi:hypothetical protein
MHVAMKHGLTGHLSTVEAEIKALDAGIVIEHGNNLIISIIGNSRVNV